MKKVLIPVIALLLLVGGGAVYWFVFRKNLDGQIVIPYIAHQKPRVDPHIPASVPLADKLDEVMFDGLFNVSANPSGVVYEDGLGEFMGIDESNVVRIRLKPNKNWHSSYETTMEKDEVMIAPKAMVGFTAKDLRFTLRRIQKLGSLSPDYILVSQAVETFDFAGPDQNNEIQFQFRDDRIWTEGDIKEVLSFKVLPANSEVNASMYRDGTGPYILAGEYEDNIHFHKNPDSEASLQKLVLRPFIDNSTYTTELKNRNINALLSTPFGSVSPLLTDSSDYFHKSSIATTFFALFYNTERLGPEQRRELRKLVDNVKIVERFFKIGTEQQRHIVDYKGNTDNYDDYLNYSIFPSTSYYVEESVVLPRKAQGTPELALLPDTVRVATCLNYGNREELAEMVEIMNDPYLFGGKIKATAVRNEEIMRGNYDAVLVAVGGYRSNFLFDLYDIFLRHPDFSMHKTALQTSMGPQGEPIADERSFQADKNFFRLDASGQSEDLENTKRLLEYVYGFMSTRHLGDKQAYAQMIDELDQQMALGSWLFSLPSLAYFRTQFDDGSIDLYGVASQLSTIEKWRDR